MLNENPIFLNAFSRGGSNILWNIFLTHPDVCSPIVETLDIFRIGRYGRWSGYKAAWLTRQPGFFNQKNLDPRQPISERAQAYIDRTLYEWKLKTYDDDEMQYKAEDAVYQPGEVEQARLCAKNNNGLAYLTDHWLAMYPGAVFFGLVRNPLPLFESYKRRRFITSVDDFVHFYRRIAGKMLADADRLDAYHIVRFEDILAHPMQTVRGLYEQAGLAIADVDKMRFKAKVHYTADGERDSDFEKDRHHWFAFDEVDSFLETDINKLHIAQLEDSEREAIRRGTAELIRRFGYES